MNADKHPAPAVSSVIGLRRLPAERQVRRSAEADLSE
jgi:hypothetical protein